MPRRRPTAPAGPTDDYLDSKLSRSDLVGIAHATVSMRVKSVENNEKDGWVLLCFCYEMRNPQCTGWLKNTHSSKKPTIQKGRSDLKWKDGQLLQTCCMRCFYEDVDTTRSTSVGGRRR